MKKLIKTIILAALLAFQLPAAAATVQNPFLWTDTPDPDIIRVGDYYYLVTTTMHMFPGGPIMRSRDLQNWETVSYLFDEIKDTPRYDMLPSDANDPLSPKGTVYGRGQWATTLRYNNGTFWALFVANDDPHKSMVFRTDDPAKGWKLHSRLPAYHDSSLFFDDDGRVYVFSGSGRIRLVELEPDLTAEKKGGVNKVLELKGMPQGLHEGSRVIKHDGMYYLLCISWPRTGRQEICYRSRNIEGPYDSKVILKSDLGGFPLAGQGTIVDGKHGEWYGVIFQDRGGVGRVLTVEPCSWIDGWPMLGNVSDGKIPLEMSLPDNEDIVADSESAPLGTTCANKLPVPFGGQMHMPGGTTMTKDFQINHNYIANDITAGEGTTVTLRTSVLAQSIYDARNTITWRTWGPVCNDTITIDARGMKDGDRVGLAAFNGDSGVLSLIKEKGKCFITFTEEHVALTNDTKAITNVERKETLRIPVSASKLRDIRMAMQGDFNPGRDIANFAVSLDKGRTWQSVGGDYKMIFDYRRLFMGSRYAAFYYPTTTTGGSVTITLPKAR